MRDRPIRRGQFTRFTIGCMLCLAAIGCSTSGSSDLGQRADTSEADAVSSGDISSETIEPHERDVRQARQFLETLTLPEEPLPPYLIETQRLQALCAEELGFPISEHSDREAAFKTGMFVHFVGDQVDRFDEVAAACNQALDELGLRMGTGRDANERLYEIYMESQECLVTNGFPTVEPPTLESFVEAPWEWYPWEALLPSGHGFTPDEQLLNSDEFRPYVESVEVCPRP